MHIRKLHVRSLSNGNTGYPPPNHGISSTQAKLSCDPCHFEIAVISDNDDKSKSNSTANVWESTFVRTTIDIKTNANNFSFTLGAKNSTTLTSSINSNSKGMELSELIYFNGHLITFDDKTGTIYYIVNNKVQPWITMTSCEGSRRYGFKSEWATIKKERLYVGSAGFAWTPSSANETEPRNCGPQWIKIVDAKGNIENENWKHKFHALQRATTCKGYITHESVVWSGVRSRWYFAPRKCSADPFDERTDGKKGANLLISADESFDKIDVVEVGQAVSTRGFSSFKFLPHSEDTIIVALKTYEDDKSLQTFITVFGIDGKVYLPDTCFSKEDKFEGVEFLSQ